MKGKEGLGRLVSAEERRRRAGLRDGGRPRWQLGSRWRKALLIAGAGAGSLSALLAGLISILCVAAVRGAGQKVSTLFVSVETAIP